MQPVYSELPWRLGTLFLDCKHMPPRSSFERPLRRSGRVPPNH